MTIGREMLTANLFTMANVSRTVAATARFDGPGYLPVAEKCMISPSRCTYG